MSKEWYHRYAKTAGVEVAEDIKLVLEGLERNKHKHGARYCPCRFDRTADSICPCLKMRDTKECCCGLFIKEKKDS